MTHRVLQLHDLDVGFVPQRVDFSPVHGNTATNLHEAELCAGVITADQAYLLGLVEVRDVPFRVDSAPEVARACPVARPPANQTEAKWVNTNADGTNIECCVTAAVSRRSGVVGTRCVLPYMTGRMYALNYEEMRSEAHLIVHWYNTHILVGGGGCDVYESTVQEPAQHLVSIE